MADLIQFEKIVTEVQNLPYVDRLRLVESIVHSLQEEKSVSVKNKKKANHEDFEQAFGIWKNRTISLATIREKAWKRK